MKNSSDVMFYNAVKDAAIYSKPKSGVMKNILLGVSFMAVGAFGVVGLNDFKGAEVLSFKKTIVMGVSLTEENTTKAPILLKNEQEQKAEQL